VRDDVDGAVGVDGEIDVGMHTRLLHRGNRTGA
jgi:hypothetical protein